MAVSEPERGAFDGKFRLEQDQIGYGTHEHESVTLAQSLVFILELMTLLLTDYKTITTSKTRH